MKNRRGISLIILILIIIAILMIAFVILFFVIKNKYRHQDKIAFTIGDSDDLRYIVTLSSDERIELPEDYLIDNKDNNKNFNFEIEDYETFSIFLNDINIEGGKGEPDFDYLITLKQKGNWYLLKNKDNEDTYIAYKANYNSTYTEWIGFIVKDSGNNDVTRDYFNQLPNIINIYKAGLDNGKIIANDFNNNVINLDEYIFIKNEVAKSLLKYGINIKNPIDIWRVEENEVEYLDYGIFTILSDKYNNIMETHKKMAERGTSVIQLSGKEYEETIGIKQFTYKNQNYELLYTYIKGYDYQPFVGVVYKKISNDLYLAVSLSNKAILKDEAMYIETAIQKFKDDLL